MIKTFIMYAHNGWYNEKPMWREVLCTMLLLSMIWFTISFIITAWIIWLM